MKIAIIGSGISGLTAAYQLYQNHDITVYEANDYIGGHTHTVEVDIKGKKYAVDTGFIVCNDRTYPNFLKILDELGVERVPTSMGFGISSDRTGVEYGTNSMNQIFAQRKNLLSPRYWKMLTEILKYNKLLTDGVVNQSLDEEISLGDFLKEQGFSQFFIDHFVIPMGSAIWSIGVKQMMEFPLLAFARFFHNHGLLTIDDHPQWYFIKGGSHSYVKKMTAGFKDKIKLSTPVTNVTRENDKVLVTTAEGSVSYDKVIFAIHSDITLKILGDPSEKESEILSAIKYQPNDVILHTDTSLLPKNKRAWSAWNYHIQNDSNKTATLTYDMNLLQAIPAPETLCVTLNETEQIDPDKILGSYRKSHPVFNKASIAAQQRYDEIGGKNHTYFCGAYWFNGFHEDGVKSALRVTDAIEKDYS